jgi:hypothetical protein
VQAEQEEDGVGAGDQSLDPYSKINASGSATPMN